jgi:hypothetical protein
MIFFPFLYYGELIYFPVYCRINIMTTTYKLYTIDELVTTIYEENLEHFDFMANMDNGDCDCNLHTTLMTIVKYWGE